MGTLGGQRNGVQNTEFCGFAQLRAFALRGNDSPKSAGKDPALPGALSTAPVVTRDTAFQGVAPGLKGLLIGAQ